MTRLPTRKLGLIGTRSGILRRRVILICLLLAIAIWSAAKAILSGGAPNKVQADTALATREIDGDTFDICFEGGNADRVRLPGIDAPETSKAARRRERDLAIGAMDFGAERIEGKRIELGLQKKIDPFNGR